LKFLVNTGVSELVVELKSAKFTGVGNIIPEGSVVIASDETGKIIPD
jgi:hypothetical protein